MNTILASKFDDEAKYKQAIASDPSLITDDTIFFEQLHRHYLKELTTFWRTHFSLKSLTGLRLLEYSPGARPIIVPLDEFVLQELFYAYRHPQQATSSGQTNWIEWVFRLRQQNKRHALEFVEGWNTTRIVIAGAIPWLISCLVGIVWTAKGGDAQTAFTVASFILSSGTGTCIC
ncbi:hypothetical protein PSPO01_01910 [Paraphaeosphaeria sporulosa]